MAEPAVTVAIVTYNSGRVVGDCLASLAAGFGAVEHEVVVADNASTDDTLAVVADVAPRARVVAIGANRGYAAGVNAAVSAAAATDAILVLNPDIRLRPDCVLPLLDALTQPGTGIVVPKLVAEDGSLQCSLRREPTVLRTAGALLLGVWRAGRVPRLGLMVTSPDLYDRPGTYDWASGAAMLVSTACLTATGPWDETFFLYSEETDFALRARDREYAVRYEPASVMVHIGGEMSTDPWLWSLATVNQVRLYRRRHGPWRSAAFAGLTGLYEATRALTGNPTRRAALRALMRPSSVRGPQAPGSGAEVGR